MSQEVSVVEGSRLVFQTCRVGDSFAVHLHLSTQRVAVLGFPEETMAKIGVCQLACMCVSLFL